jgi:hypothetical protein
MSSDILRDRRGQPSHESLALLFPSLRRPEAKQPNPMRSIDERRHPDHRADVQDSDRIFGGRDIGQRKNAPCGRETAGRKYGVAYLTTGDLSGLDSRPISPHTGGDLPVVQGAGEDNDAVVLLLFAPDYQYDDLSGDQHESTTITAEKKLARDVRDFLVQARARNLP